jgi:hypothetical protein
MSEIRPKRLPVRLDAKAYRELCKEVLAIRKRLTLDAVLQPSPYLCHL